MARGSTGASPWPRARSANYKLRIVAEYDAAPAGEKGAILRRERLYHSHVIEWRRARDAGAVRRGVRAVVRLSEGNVEGNS
jgi:transposase